MIDAKEIARVCKIRDSVRTLNMPIKILSRIVDGDHRVNDVVYNLGDSFTHDGELYTMCADGLFRNATNHPRNPEREEMMAARLNKTLPGVGYHVRSITKQKFGTVKKIVEEYEELLDAKEQGCKIMELVELADIIGAVEGYLVTEFPGMTLDDLLKMSSITKRAFESGSRG